MFYELAFDSVLGWIIFILFFFLYPKLYMMQIIWKLENDLKEVEEYLNKSKRTLYKHFNAKDKKTKKIINNFLDFVVAFPVDIEPINLVKKIQHILDRYDQRFRYFVDRMIKTKDEEVKKDIRFALIGTAGLNQLYKILRHYIIMIKKTNNLQLALILQMTMPMITKLAKANARAVESFANRIPIGDAIGPLIAAQLKTKEGEEIAEEVVISKEKFAGREVYVMKASGPGAALGKISQGVEKAIKKYKINHIITIDAAAKLEGEKTGSVSEGVGVMMGGIGVERHHIEDLAIKYNIPLDGVIIKMSPEEAAIPMKKEIFNAKDKAIQVLESLINEVVDKKERVLIIGVGNTGGVGNSKKTVKDVENRLTKFWKSIKGKEEWEDYFEEKKKRKVSYPW